MFLQYQNQCKILHRHSTRLKGYDYSRAGAYFLTVCTKDRKYVFGDIVDGKMQLNEAGQMVKESWVELNHKYKDITLDAFVIMPNHVHGIIVLTNDNVGAVHEPPEKDSSKQQNNAICELPSKRVIHELPLQKKIERRNMAIPRIMGYFKMNSAKRINVLRNTPGISVWQRNYYEHVIRNEGSLERIREYIANNTLKWEDDIENLESRVIRELPRQSEGRVKDYYEKIF